MYNLKFNLQHLQIHTFERVFLADGVCVQSIEHPGCVWDAKFLENGDIVTACSDGIARVWTVQQDKFAEPLELETHASQISQYKRNRYKQTTIFSSRIIAPSYTRCRFYLVRVFSRKVL